SPRAHGRAPLPGGPSPADRSGRAGRAARGVRRADRHARRARGRGARRAPGARSGEPLTVIDARVALLPPVAATLVRLLGGAPRLRGQGGDALVALSL